MTQVDFIIGGATRSGTRSLQGILNAHPRVYMPEFNPRRKKQKGRNSYFDVGTQGKKKGKTLIGEWEDVAEDCFKDFPDAKIIFNLRNPVTRAYSQFRKAKREGKEKGITFEQAIQEEMEGIRRPETTGKCWIYKSQYQIHLDEWFALFPREKILILIMEEWIDSPRVGLAPLEQFLGLEKYSLGSAASSRTRESSSSKNRLSPLLDKIPLMNNSGDPPMTEAMKDELEDIFSVDKLYVANTLNRNVIEAWK